MRLLGALGRRSAPRAAAGAPVRPLTPARRRPMSRRLSRFVDSFAAELSTAARRTRRR
jgi:hypothetical protein